MRLFIWKCNQSAEQKMCAREILRCAYDLYQIRNRTCSSLSLLWKTFRKENIHIVGCNGIQRCTHDSCVCVRSILACSAEHAPWCKIVQSTKTTTTTTFIDNPSVEELAAKESIKFDAYVWVNWWKLRFHSRIPLFCCVVLLLLLLLLLLMLLLLVSVYSESTWLPKSIHMYTHEYSGAAVE